MSSQPVLRRGGQIRLDLPSLRSGIARSDGGKFVVAIHCPVQIKTGQIKTGNARKSETAEHPLQSVSRGFRSAGHGRVRSCAPLYRPALPVAAGTEAAAAYLRRGAMRLPFQASQGQTCRPAPAQ